MADIEENIDSDEKVGSDVSFTTVDEFVCSDSSNESRPGTPVIPSFDDILSTIDNSLPKENRSLNDFGPTAGFTLHPENHKNDKMCDDLMDPNHDSDEKNNKSPDNCSFVDNNADISLHPVSNECSLVSESICNEILVEDNIGSVAPEEFILQTDNNMINPDRLSQKSDNFASLESEIDPLSEPSPIYDSVNEISEIVRKSPPFMSSDVFPNSEKNSAMNFDASFCDMPLKTIFSGDESSEHSDASGSNKLEASHSMPKYQLNNESDISSKAISNKNYLNDINVKPCKLVIKRLSSEEIKNYDPIIKSKSTHEIPVLKFNRKSRLLKSKFQGIKSHELELHNSLTSSVTQKRLQKDLPDLSSFESVSSLESLSALYKTDDKTRPGPHLLIKKCEIKLYRCDEPSAQTKDMKSASHISIEKHDIVMREVTDSASLPLRHRGRPKTIELISSSKNLKEQKKMIAEDEEVSLKMKDNIKPVDRQSINRRGRPKKVKGVAPSEKNNVQIKKIANCDEDNLQVKEVTESSYPRGAPKKTEAMSSFEKKDVKLIKKNYDREEDSLTVNEKESKNSHVRSRGRPKKNEEISSYTKKNRDSKKIIDKKVDTVIMNGVSEYSDKSARFHGRSKRVRKISSSSDDEEHVNDKACKRDNISFKIKPCKVMILRNPALNEFLKSKKEIDLVGESSKENEQSKITSSSQKSSLKSKKDRSEVKFDVKKSVTKHIQGNKISKKNERQESSYLSIKPCQVLLTRINIDQYHTNSTKTDNSNSLVSSKRKKSQGYESYSEESDVDIISEKLSKKNNRREISKDLDDSDHQKRNKQENGRKREVIPKSTTPEKLTSLKRENESSTSKRGRKRKKLELSDSHTNEKILNMGTIDTDSENILEIERNEESSEKSHSKRGRKKKVQYSECTKNQINCGSELSTDITEKTPGSSKIVDKDSEKKNSSEALNKSLTDESRSSKRGRKKKEVQFSECTEDQINCGSDLSTDKTPGSSQIVDKNSEEKNSSEVLSKSLKKESKSSERGRKKKKIQFSECTENQISCGSRLSTDKTPESSKIVDKDSDEKNSELLSKSLTEKSGSSKRGRKKKEVQLSECSEDQINCSSEVSTDITDKTPRSSKVVDKDSEKKNSSGVLSKSLTNESRSSKHRKKMRQQNPNNEDENNFSNSEQSNETIEQRLQNKTPCVESDKAKTLNNSTESLKSTTESNLGDEEEKNQMNLLDGERERESEQSNECVNEEVKSKQISDASCEKSLSPSAENSNDDAEKSNPNMDEGSNLSFSSLGNDEMTSKNGHEEIEEKKQKLVSSDEEGTKIKEIYDVNTREENELELSYNSEEVKKSDSDQCNTTIHENLNNQQNNHFAETITKNCNKNTVLPKLLSDSEDGIFDNEQCNKTIDVESKCDQVSENTIAECDTLKETPENSQILHIQEPNSGSVQRKISQILSDSDEEQCKSELSQCKENDKLSCENDVTMEIEKQTRFSPKPVECPTTEDLFKMHNPSNTVSDEMKVSVDSDENQKSGLDLQSEIEKIKSSENVESSGLTDGTM